MNPETVAFDPEWYLDYYADVHRDVASGQWGDAWAHYRTCGAFEGRSPNPLFDEVRYRELYPDVAEAIRQGALPCGALHYALSGAREGRSPSEWFEADLYAAHHPESVAAVDRGEVGTLWHHCLLRGLSDGVVPNVAFDTSAFVARHPEFCAASEEHPFVHFLRRGVLEWTEPAVGLAPMVERDGFRRLARSRLEGFLRSETLLELETSPGTPEVSIIVVIRDGAELLFQCLTGLARAMPPAAEVILVDNASGPETKRLLSRVRGARIFEQSTNLHFVLGSNLGAAQARGRHLLFLNSDVEVVPGAIEAAVGRLASDPRIGAVGAKLLGLDSRILEFGCRFDAQGYAFAILRGEHVDDWRTWVAQSAAYCSGAFLLTRTDLFEEVGGFDPVFAPAYYEDADYCFRLARRGLLTVVEPRALASHFEHGSSDRGPLLEALGRRNRLIFNARHSEQIERLSPRTPLWPANVPVGGTGRRRVLFVDDRLPLDRDGSGYPRARRMLDAFRSLGLDVSMVFPGQPEGTPIPDETDALVLRDATSFAALLRERAGWFSTLWVSRPHNMRLVRDAIREEPDLLRGIRLVYDAEAIYAAREARRPGVAAQDPGERAWDQRREIGLAVHADHVVCVSGPEAHKFADAGWPTSLVSHHVDETEETTETFEQRNGLLVVAAVHAIDSPNYDGLRWFFQRVWPAVRQMMPDLTITVAGAWTAPAQLPCSDAEGVRWLRAVDDLRPLFQTARVFVAPVRYGAGIPLKIIDSAAFGLPVCTTSAMAELLEWDTSELLLADAPEAFARRCVELHECAQLWSDLRSRAAVRVRQEYTRERFEYGIAEALGVPTPRQAVEPEPIHRLVRELESVALHRESVG